MDTKLRSHKSSMLNTVIKPLFHKTRRFLATRYLRLMPARQIAITGSQGKTNTTYVLSKLLTSLGKVQKTDTNLDTIYNVPITALKVRPWHKFVIFELGVDHPGEMTKHLEIVHPQVVVMTGISPVHTDNAHFGSLQKLIDEKVKLIKSLPPSGYAILNYDDVHIRKMAKLTKANILWYGTSPNNCNVWADSVEVTLNGLKMTLHDGTHSITVDTTLIGKHHMYTIMAAYLVGRVFELPDIKFIKKIKEIKPLKGRMSVEPGPLGSIVLNDALRANPYSMAFGLITLDNIPLKNNKKIAILGQMGELEFPEDEHRKIGQLLSTLHIDEVICIGEFQKYVYEEAIKKGFDRKHIYFAENVFDAADILKPLIKKGDVIYLKGSLAKRIDRVIGILKGTKIYCNEKLCHYYNPCATCKILKSTSPNHIHHDDTHE